MAAAQARAGRGRSGGVEGEAAFDGVARHGGAASCGEQRLVGSSVAFVEPCTQDGDGVTGQWRDAVLAAFAVAGDMGAGAKVDVLASQPGEGTVRFSV